MAARDGFRAAPRGLRTRLGAPSRTRPGGSQLRRRRREAARGRHSSSCGSQTEPWPGCCRLSGTITYVPVQVPM